MKSIWQRLMVKLLIWLAAEILLTFLGLDDLADYSEFIYKQPTFVSLNQATRLI